jgi:hypothetical protein
MYGFNPERRILDTILYQVIAVALHDNYTVSFIIFSVNWYNRFFLIPNRINEFVKFSNVLPPFSTNSVGIWSLPDNLHFLSSQLQFPPQKHWGHELMVQLYVFISGNLQENHNSHPALSYSEAGCPSYIHLFLYTGLWCSSSYCSLEGH